MSGYRDIQIREGGKGPEIVCYPDAESGMVPVLSLTEENLALLVRRIAEREASRTWPGIAGRVGPESFREPLADLRAAKAAPRLQRIIELLGEYGEAKFGDEWWPGNASNCTGAHGEELERLLETWPMVGPPASGGESDAQVIAAADVAARQAEVARRGAELDDFPDGSPEFMIRRSRVLTTEMREHQEAIRACSRERDHLITALARTMTTRAIATAIGISQQVVIYATNRVRLGGDRRGGGPANQY